MTQRILIERSNLAGGEWTQVGPSMVLTDWHGSGTAIRDGEEVLVVFGFDEAGVPRVWLDKRLTADAGRLRLHVGPSGGPPADGLMPLANLRDGPFELDGKAARWRWSLITD